MKQTTLLAAALCCIFFSCEKAEKEVAPEPETGSPATLSLEELANIMSLLPLDVQQMREVHDAASSSAGNGYDEEYTMSRLLTSPGAGVGDSASDTKAGAYSHPLREALSLAVEEYFSTKAASLSAEEYLEALENSDLQIYWPFSDSWDGETLPVITYDPGEGLETNEGFLCCADGSRETVTVTEEMARERPVWVINRNDDSSYRTLEMLRREDPSWGQGGGEIYVRPMSEPSDDFQTLVLKSFRSDIQYDNWFSGASEFFVKIGSVEDFKASTEGELRLYQPSITDFMVVVKRKDVGLDMPLNVILVSEWTEQLESCALMIVEDDGGTRTSWKCNATVKINSKSYGVELEIPLYSRDDIVWRGSLSRRYIGRYSGQEGHFGNIAMTLELI